MNCCGNSNHSNKQKDDDRDGKNQGSRIFSILHWVAMLAVVGYLIIQFLK